MKQREKFYILQQLQDYSFVPRVFDYFTSKYYAYVVMENLTYEWQDLFQFTQEPINEKELRHIMIGVVKALGQMSSLNLHYLDIKPNNVMIHLESRNIKFIDFESVFHEEGNK